MSDTTTTQQHETASQGRALRAVRLQEYALVFVIVALVVVGMLVSDRFLSDGDQLGACARLARPQQCQQRAGRSCASWVKH